MDDVPALSTAQGEFICNPSGPITESAPALALATSSKQSATKGRTSKGNAKKWRDIMHNLHRKL